MKRRIVILALVLITLAQADPVFAHGDEAEQGTLQIQTPKAVPLASDALTLEIIPNWHPIFVHFTIGLLLTATLLFVIGKLAPATASWRLTCLAVARWNLAFGVFITAGTVLAGWYAFDTVNHDDHSHGPMLSHRLWALSTAGAFILLALWSGFTRGKEPHPFFVVCLLVASGSLAVTGFKGGELVYRHGLGVMSMPETDGHVHRHDAGGPMDMQEMKVSPATKTN